jgi:hypothetical protein
MLRVQAVGQFESASRAVRKCLATTNRELKQLSKSHYGFVTILIDTRLSDGPASQALREIR